MNRRTVDLIQYMPGHIREMNEFKQMCSAEDKEIQLLWDRLYQFVVDMDMYTMSERMCERWEKFFGIKDKSLLSLDDRRQLIRGYFASQLPYTLEKLETTLSQMCGEYYRLNIEGYQADIGVGLESKFAIDNVEEVTRQMIPAHIGINLYLIYNNHGVLAEYPHYILGQFTHEEIRATVIHENISATCGNLANYTCGRLQGINISHLSTYGMRKVG